MPDHVIDSFPGAGRGDEQKRALALDIAKVIETIS
jgi:hypothetical protein